jgi:ABC-type uncharacterized transport system permease subunit
VAKAQAALGGLGATLVVLALVDTPAPLVLAVAVLAAASFGAAWAFVPAVLQVRRGSNLVITTIMFKFIAAGLMTWLLVVVLIAPGQSALETRTFPPPLWLPTLADITAGTRFDAGEAPLNPIALLALLAPAICGILLHRTPLGYEIRAAGFNPLVAQAAGIRVPRIILLAVCGGGAFAGRIAINELFGAQHRLTTDLTAGAGFAGIAVALLGRGHPLGVVFAAVLFGALNQGGRRPLLRHAGRHPRCRHRRRGCRDLCLRHARRCRARPYRPISANSMDDAGAAGGVSVPLLSLAGSTVRLADRAALRPGAERGSDRRTGLHRDRQRPQPAGVYRLARRAADRFRAGPHPRWPAAVGGRREP